MEPLWLGLWNPNWFLKNFNRIMTFNLACFLHVRGIYYLMGFYSIFFPLAAGPLIRHLFVRSLSWEKTEEGKEIHVFTNCIIWSLAGMRKGFWTLRERLRVGIILCMPAEQLQRTLSHWNCKIRRLFIFL